MFKRAAVRPAEPLLFILADTQITDERFLVPVNDLLSTGRVRDLFTKDEYDSIFSSLRVVAKGEGVPENRDSMVSVKALFWYRILSFLISNSLFFIVISSCFVLRR